MSSFTIPSIIVWTLAVLAVSIVVQFIAYVIVNGSIFDAIRALFKTGMRNNILGAETLHELFTCTLCMLTQVSLWLVGLPMAVVIYRHSINSLPVETSGSLVIALAGGIVSAFVIGGLANILMTRVEYPSKRYHALYQRYEDALARIEFLEAMGGKGHFVGDPALDFLYATATGLHRHQPELEEVKEGIPRDVFSLANFQDAVKRIDRECSGIACSIRRANCRREMRAEVATRWTEENKMTATQGVQFKRQFNRALDRYYDDHRSFRQGEDRDNFLAKVYEAHFPRRDEQIALASRSS